MLHLALLADVAARDRLERERVGNVSRFIDDIRIDNWAVWGGSREVRGAPRLGSDCWVLSHLASCVPAAGHRLKGRWAQQEDQAHGSEERQCVPQAAR